MPLTRQQKETRVAEAHRELSSATSFVFFGFTGLTVADSEELRDKLSAANARVRVLPKKLLRLVTKQLSLDFDPVAIPGQIAVVWGSDAVTPARILAQFAKERANVQMLTGSLEGAALSLAQVQALAALPGRAELLGQLVGAMNNPVRGLVVVLSGVPRQAVQVLKAIADQRQKS